MKRVTGAVIAAAAVTGAIVMGHSSPETKTEPSSGDCQVITKNGGDVSPELMAEDKKLAEQMCRDLAGR